ncbi:MAG: hypothetical protein GF390_00745, partial [Candidatus Pacebacteria bacterium]|nr:hypothetical protein [Candidatus Paceibacterota bacterium]
MSKLLYHPVVILIFTLLSVTLSVSLYQSLTKTHQARENLSILKKEINQQTSQITATQEQLNQAQTPLVQEKIWRDELLLQKQGEYIVQLPELDKAEQLITPTPTASPW